MKLIKPAYQIIDQLPGLEGIYNQIEIAGRTCYRSQRPEGQTAKDFVDRMIKSGHGAMLEHGTVYLKLSKNNYVKDFLFVNFFEGDKYSVVNLIDNNYYITTNLRVIVEGPDHVSNNWKSYAVSPTKHHEKRITVRFTTSNSIMREFTRHRVMSFAVESTRYCNYSKGRFDNEITFIQPYWYKDQVRYVRDRMFIFALNDAESAYMSLIKWGCKPQEAREVLPLATKCDMVMTGFVSDWEHFFSLRTSIIAETGMPHPDASTLADPLYKEFIKRGYIS